MDAPLAVIVGAGPGVGAAAARRLARDGHAVGLVAREPDRLAELGAALLADGITASWADAEVADAPALTRAIGSLVERAGRVDVLHFNAVAFRAARSHELTAEDLLADLAVGTAGLVTAVRAVLPAMRAAGSGTILVTGSGAADHPMTGAASLGVQKAAIRSLAQAMAADLAPDGIHVATVTVRGVLRPGTPFGPDRIADVLAALVAESAQPPATWRTVVDYTGT